MQRKGIGRKAKEIVYDTYSCELCDKLDTDEMVSCDLCSKWYHFSCVGVTSIGEEDDFVCRLCQEEVNINLSTPDRSDLRSHVRDSISYVPISSPTSSSHLVNSEANEQFQEINSTILEPSVPVSLQVNMPGTLNDQNQLTTRGQCFNAYSLRYVQSCSYPRMTPNINNFFSMCGRETVRPQVLSTMVQGNILIGFVPTGNVAHIPSHERIVTQTPGRTIQQNQILADNRFRSREYYQNEILEDNSTLQRDQKCNPSSNGTTFEMSRRFAEQVRNIHLSNASNHPNSQSAKLSSTRSSKSSCRQMIELARVEEERILKEKRDNEYLRQKYSILLEDCDSSTESKYTDRSELTAQWVKSQFRTERPAQATEAFGIRNRFGISPNDFQEKLNKIQFDTTSPIKSKQQATTKNNFSCDPNASTPNANKSSRLSQLNQPSININPLSNAYQPFINTKPSMSESQQTQPQFTTDDQCGLTKAQIASRHVVSKDLPAFSGNPMEWPMFISRFYNSTKTCGFSNQENLDRLQKCLKGKALDAVRSRLLTEESVPDVISTLKMLFGRPELVINALLIEIRQEPSPRADKLNTLIDFAMKVGNLNAVMVQSGLQSYLSNPTVMKELVDKLPPNYKVEWARYKQTQFDANLGTFGDWMHQLAETISSVVEPTISRQPEKRTDNKFENKTKKESCRSNNKNDDEIHLGSQVFVHNESNQKIESETCPICQKRCQGLETCSVFLSYDVDRRWKELKDKQLCRKCLGRHGKFCRTDKKCGTDGCIYKHHSLLHDSKRHSEQAQLMKTVNPVTSSSNVHGTFLRRILLRIVPVVIHAGNRSVSIFAYLDDGSDLTIINKSVIDGLEIRGTSEPLCLLWTGDMHREENESRRVTFFISGTDTTRQYCLRDVRTVRDLGLKRQTLIKSEMVERFDYLKDVPIVDYRDALPEILIGSDNVSLIAQLEIIEGEYNQPIASRTRLGWSIYGDLLNRTYTLTEARIHPHRSICPYNTTNYDEIHRQVKDFFTLENFGVRPNVTLLSKEDERALDILKKYTERVGNRFKTALLWKYDSIQLPDSYDMALKRLKCLEKHKPNMIKIINETIEDYIKKRYVTKLSDEMIKIKSRVWYLPIFAVSHSKKPEKIRTVFDAAAIVKGVSLNSMLIRGPDQMANLIDILRRFREKRYGIAGDIKEMFHQVEIRDEDKQAQRFLWRNGNQSMEPAHYVMNVMTFGAKCSPSAAQFVKNLNASSFKDKYPRAVDAIVKNHYVDDWLDGEDDEDKLMKLANEVIEIHSHGGFEMRNFLSNSINIMKQFGNRQNGGKNLNLEINLGTTERVLGMWWDTRNDNLTFSLKYFKIDQNIVDQTKAPTKREVLKILMSVFDPLGLLSHYLIQLKILLQKVWRSGIDWDDELNTEEMILDWKNWLQLLPKVETVKIPRLISSKISPNTAKSTELHVFVDASEQAFCAVAFLRTEDDEGVDCNIIGSKVRVAPLKHLSVPRLELQAGVLGTRLIKSICEGQSFRFNRRQIWTDSTTLLSWIRSDHRKYHQFVANRVGEIIDDTDIQEWRWVPTRENVADDATKWKKPPSFNQTDRWFSGPPFLRLTRDRWPKQESVIKPDTMEEMKVVMVHRHLVVPVFVKPHKFSSWRKMHRTMAFVVRYVRNLRAKVQRKELNGQSLTQSELLAAEKLIIRQAQFESFTEEYIILKRNKELQLPPEREVAVEKSSPIYKCSPYLDDDDLIRIRGRIDLALNVSYSQKRPIIMPRNHKITRLLVDNYHRTYHHRNDRTVHNEICQKFFIPSVRVIIRSVRNDCQRCKIRHARANPPEMAVLPMPRLAVGLRAFTFIGIDYFGPIFVTVGRSSVKRWGMLITCMTVRAINIEIVYRANTESCIMGLRNHINEYGQPDEIFSDPGSNFKGTNNELKKFLGEIDQERMATEFTTICTKWNLNPPKASHMGGTWERMIRSVKTCLYEILPAKNLTDDALRNLVLEVVNVVNSRPLSYVPLDHEGDEVLTPNHFIKGSSNGIKPMIDVDANGPVLRCKWKENQRLMEQFWSKFIEEFLPELTRRTKWFEPVEPLKVGDIVLIIDKANKRNVYPKARVIDAIKDSRGQVRRVRVQRANGSALWRPAHGLAKLDVLKEVSEALQEDFKTEGTVLNVNTDLAKAVTEERENEGTTSEN